MELTSAVKCKTCFRQKAEADSATQSQWISACRCDNPYSPSSRFSLDVCANCKQCIPPDADGAVDASGLCSCSRRDAKKIPGQIKQTEQDAVALDIASLRMTAANFPLERYTPIAVLGDNIRATIILARDKVRGGKVAVKCYKKLPAALKTSFLNEAKKLQQLNHSNIVKTIDCGLTQAGTPYVVTDFKEALNLDQCIAAYGTPSHDVTIRILAGICEAVVAAQKQGMLHRNIKPANVLFFDDRNAEPSILLRDFAMHKGDPLEEAATTSDLLYMSSDEARNMDYTEKSEMYAVGNIGYLLVTGKAPFDEGEPREIKNLHALKLQKRMADIKFDNTRPKQLDELIERCLEKDPSYRFDSMPQLLERLQALLRMEQAQHAQVLAGQQLKKVLTVGGAALVVAIIATIAFFTLHH